MLCHPFVLAFWAPGLVQFLQINVVFLSRSLLFGPFAGFSTKFLKHGSSVDTLRRDFLQIRQKHESFGRQLANEI